MGYQVAPKDAPVAYIIVGYTNYEESISLAIAMTIESARTWRDTYESHHPNHGFDGISIDTVELIQG